MSRASRARRAEMARAKTLRLREPPKYCKNQENGCFEKGSFNVCCPFCDWAWQQLMTGGFFDLPLL